MRHLSGLYSFVDLVPGAEGSTESHEPRATSLTSPGVVACELVSRSGGVTLNRYYPVKLTRK